MPDGTRVDIHQPEPSPDDTRPQTMALNPNWSWLSPLTHRVVKLLCRSGWLSREEIATQLEQPPEGDIRTLLCDLAKRGILESSGRKGYHLGIPETANPDAYRKQLLDWLLVEEARLPERES